MRIDPAIDPAGKLPGMLRSAGREDLIAGFDVDDVFYRQHCAEVVRSHPDMCANDLYSLIAYSALFHPNAPHNQKLAPAPAETSTPAEAPPVAVNLNITPLNVLIEKSMQALEASDRRAGWHRLIQIILLWAILLATCFRAHAAGPAAGVIVRGSNGASVLVTRSGGLLNFKCDGVTVICSWSAPLNTFTFTAASGANWSTAGNTHIFTFMDSGRPPLFSASGFGLYAANTVYAIAVPANVSGVINKIDGFLRQGVAATKGADVGVYDGSGNLIASSNLVAPNGQPQTWALGSTVTITAGSLYWLAWCTEDSAAAELFSLFGSANDATMYNVNGQIRSATAANACTGTGASLVMPATLGTITANASKDTAPFLQGRP